MRKWGERIGVVFIMVSLSVGIAWGALPRSATLATHAVGSLYNALGTGIATVISRNTPMNVRVQAFAGPPAWLPSMEQGETDMGVLTSADAVTSYKGIVLYKKPFKNTRILVVGGVLRLSFYVAKDSPVDAVSDLKGKKIPTDYPGTPIVMLSSTAGLASAGLTYNDVVKVPVSDLQAGAQAFMEGRTDAGWHSGEVPRRWRRLTPARGCEVDLRHLHPGRGEEDGRGLSGQLPVGPQGGVRHGVVKDTVFLTNDIYLVGSKGLTDETAYEAVKALWEHNEELGAAYPGLKAWTRERMVSSKAFIPYHPGAIKFFKEKGVWSKELDDLQANLLAQ